MKEELSSLIREYTYSFESINKKLESLEMECDNATAISSPMKSKSNFQQ